MTGARDFDAQLRDGTPVRLRPLTEDDRALLLDGFERLSPESRYQRFHAATERLSDATLDYLVDVDQVDHLAWAALDVSTDPPTGVGVARAVRLPDEPTVAEAALTVTDDYHGRGAGTLLLGTLAGAARAVGITTFRNYVLAGNHGMLEVLEDLGGSRRTEAPGVYRIDLPVPGDDDDLPDTPAGRAFRAAAAGRLRMARLDPPVWDDSETPSGSGWDWLRRRHPRR